GTRAGHQRVLSGARRHALAARRSRPAGARDRRADRAGAWGRRARGDSRAQCHGRRPDDRPLHHRSLAERQRQGDEARARRTCRRRARLPRRGHARGGDPEPHHVLVPRTRSSHTLATNPIANFGLKRGTRIINLLEPISKSSEEDNEAGELDESEEVLGVILPADEDAALPLDPRKEAFDEPTTHVAA